MYHTLIVDDEKIEREGIKKLLLKSGLPINVAEAENGLKALQYSKNHTVDILVTDIKMPFMDGLQLAEEVRKVRSDTKIVILSAYGEFDLAKKAIGLSVNEYILKPVIVSEFMNAFSKVLRLCEQNKQESDTWDQPESLPETTGSKRKVIDQVYRIIQRQYMNDISLEIIAEQVYLAPGYVSHLFKKEHGVSIVKYIAQYRLEKAKELLTKSNMKIVDISSHVGYANPSYFCTLFKNHYGVTPAQYREENH